MQRFFVSPDALSTTQVRLTGDTARQISRVLRMRPGDELLLLDGSGMEYKARLAIFGKEDVWCEMLEKRVGSAEPHHRVDLYLSLLNKPDKFEWALQKCTELGAARFIPVVAERSIADAPGQGRQERWERIIQEAAEQSGRSTLPSLSEAIPLKRAIVMEGERARATPDGAHLAIMPAMGATHSLHDLLTASEGIPNSASLFIGPEGGFSEPELGMAQDCGIHLVTLGSRTLRAETAAVATLTIVTYAFGEMGGQFV